jgi:cellulose synthase/poly-beta-1,6-N-acetylglucosamine synthase-like glycosyltransferase
MVSYEVAIPSYKRHTQIVSKTLKTLARQGVPADKITVFVANDDEKALYQTTISDGSVKDIIVGVVGLVAQRNFISSYYPSDTFVVSVDDDVESVYRATGSTQKDKQEINLPEFFEYAFAKMEQEQSSIWGIYAVDNPFFMINSQETTTSLKYLVGCLYGSRTPFIPLVTQGCIEDKERTLRYYLKEGKTLRFNHIGIKTKYFGSGGLESENRKKQHDIDTDALISEFPTLVTKITRKNGYPDLRFKNEKKYPKN